MERMPSINIRLDHFIEVCEDLGISMPESLACKIFKRALLYTCHNRVIVETKSNKKAIDGAGNLINLFNRELYNQRHTSNHKNLRQITTTDPLFSYIKKGASNCELFCAKFKLDPIEGVPVFVRLILKAMGRKFNIKRMDSYLDWVYNYYVSVQAIDNDDKYDETKKLRSAYLTKMGRSRATAMEDILENPIEKVNFIFARIDCESKGANYIDWIAAQYDGLEFTGSIPMPSQLHGDGAIKRYLNWVIQNPGKVVKNNKDSNSDYWEWVSAELQKSRQ